MCCAHWYNYWAYTNYRKHQAVASFCAASTPAVGTYQAVLLNKRLRSACTASAANRVLMSEHLHVIQHTTSLQDGDLSRSLCEHADVRPETTIGSLQHELRRHYFALGQERRRG